MATYTTNLNLKKPTTSEMYNVLDWNDNSDKIDQAVGNLNSQITNKSGTAGTNTKVKRTGNVVYCTCTTGSNFSVQSGTNYLMDGDSAIQIPSGFRPIELTETRENYGNSRLQIQQNGYVLAYGTITGGIARFSACWITGDDQPS